MHVLLFANGNPPSRTLAQRMAAAHDLLIATDGAAHKATALGLTPDIVSGDFDSVRMEAAQAALPNAEFVATPDQDRADLEKAIHLARECGAAALTILGANGGRIDHTLANFALLLRYHNEITLRIVEDGAAVWAISGGNEVPASACFGTEPGDTVSVISLDGQARVSIAGVHWPLNDYSLPIGTLGISNKATGREVTVTARGGTLLVCHLYPVQSEDDERPR